MKSRILTCITALMLSSALAIPVQLAAQNALGLKYTVLYSFTGAADGGGPVADLARDAAGNIYGTGYFGGSGLGGVVFELDTGGLETVPYSFAGGAAGDTPVAGLVRDEEGNLYGTAQGGGDFSGTCSGSGGCGVVFKLDPTGNYTVLYTFTGPDGKGPTGDLVRDSDGNLYGTTFGGGPSGTGVVFKLDTMCNETVLYPFTGGADGGQPYAGLVRDEEGNLYGTASSGGTSNAGAVFKVDPTGRESVLYNFTGGADGAGPLGRLVRDSQGNLYGTTQFGGDSNSWGVVFKVDTTAKETVLYTFTGGADGGSPSAGLLRDQQGNLYGTTQNGGDLGSQQGWCAGFGCGVVFKLSACRTALCRDN